LKIQREIERLNFRKIYTEITKGIQQLKISVFNNMTSGRRLEKNIWAQEGRGNRGVEKNTQ